MSTVLRKTFSLSLFFMLIAAKGPVAPDLDTSTMITFTAGQFQMGWPESNVGPYGDAWYVDQQPARTITLSTYALDTTEVTARAFSLFLTYAGGEMYFDERQPIERVRDGYLSVQERGDEPIRYVTWAAARDYCRWAGKRLPSEAEWSFAIRGTESRVYPWAEGGPNCQRTNYFAGGTHCKGAPVDVASYPDGVSPEGIFDLSGNVAEWTDDDYALYDPANTHDPIVRNSGGLKVIRGGGWMDPPQALRGHSRRAVRENLKSNNIGFRCAWSEGSTLDATRGELAPPEDLERESAANPIASPAATPTPLLDGLVSPKGLARLGDSWIVADTGMGQIWQVPDDGANAKIVLDGLGEPTALASGEGAVWIVDSAQSQLLRWEAEATEAVVVSTLPETPVHVAIDAQGALIASESTVYDTNTDPPTAVMSGLDGISSIALRDGFLYVTVLGTSNLANAQVLRSTRDGGGAGAIVGQNVLQNVFHVPSITWRENTGEMTFPVVRAGWPYSGVISYISTDNKLILGTHGPPGMKWLQATSDGLVVGCTDTLIHATDNAPYSVIATWTTPSAVAVDEQGRIVWLDRKSGVLYRSE